MTGLRVVLVAALVVAACRGGSGDRPATPPNEAVLAVLGTARALHHEADVYENAGDFVQASEAVRRVLALAIPPGMAEAEDLRSDAYGRLAELALRRNAPDEARALADTGLRDTQRESVLRGRLLRVRGQCFGALADRDHAAGDETSAARDRAEAIRTLEESIAMNLRIVRRLTQPGAR